LTAAEARMTKLVALIEQTDSPAPLLRQMEAVEDERPGYRTHVPPLRPKRSSAPR